MPILPIPIFLHALFCSLLNVSSQDKEVSSLMSQLEVLGADLDSIKDRETQLSKQLAASWKEVTVIVTVQHAQNRDNLKMNREHAHTSPSFASSS